MEIVHILPPDLTFQFATDVCILCRHLGSVACSLLKALETLLARCAQLKAHDCVGL